MNDKIRYIVRNTPGVRLIVGADTKPVPLTDAEYQEIMKQVNGSETAPIVDLPYSEGDEVMIKDESLNLNGIRGTVKKIDFDKGVALVDVEILHNVKTNEIPLNKISAIK